MSFERGRFGIEYNPTRMDGESHPFRWVLLVLAILAAVSFFCARGCRKAPGPAPENAEAPPPEPPPKAAPPAAPSQPTRRAETVPARPPPVQTQAARPQDQTKPTPTPAAAPPVAKTTVSAPAVKPLSKEAKAAAKWLETAQSRPSDEAALLARLADAERLGNVRIVRDTLEKLCRRNSMADLEDQFARRLGVLNAESLFAAGPKERDGWTTTITVKRGDSANRIAREHGTTLAAVLKLNALKDANRIRTGDKLRVLEFPRAELVVHAGLRFADLSLNKRFFKRYDVLPPPQPGIGSYPVTREEGPMDRFAALKLKFTPADRDELALLLAPGSRIIVSPQ